MHWEEGLQGPLNSVKQAVNQLVHTMCIGQKTEKDWNEESIDPVNLTE